MPILVFTTLLGCILYLTGSRLVTALHVQFEAGNDRQQAYYDMQLRLQQTSELTRRTLHDLRTPIASIQLFTEFMLKYAADKDAELKDNLESVHECCRQANELLNETSYLRSDLLAPGQAIQPYTV